jgi:hypothetical protein
VLALIVGSFIFAAAAPDDDWTSALLLLAQCTTLVAALWTSGVGRFDSRWSLMLSAGAAALAFVALQSGGARLTALVGLVTGVLVAVTIGVISRGVVSQGVVNTQSVGGAICIYLLLGLLFVFCYGVIAGLSDEAFFAQGPEEDRALRVYFSFVTLATLGYGDYTPASDVGRTFAIVEALLGQLYLVTIVALLVSRMGLSGARRHPQEDDPR